VPARLLEMQVGLPAPWGLASLGQAGNMGS
jgi:hypothetical protein